MLANWLDVPDAMAFLEAFAEAAEKTRGWKLEGIKVDCGFQTVVARYTGRKFQGKGLMAVVYAPLNRSKRVNITLRAEEWPEHVCFDEIAKTLLAPILKVAKRAEQPFRRIAR